MTYITSPSYTERLLADNDDSDVTYYLKEFY